jgi:hypothetical protein
MLVFVVLLVQLVRQAQLRQSQGQQDRKDLQDLLVPLLMCKDQLGLQGQKLQDQLELLDLLA